MARERLTEEDLKKATELEKTTRKNGDKAWRELDKVLEDVARIIYSGICTPEDEEIARRTIVVAYGELRFRRGAKLLDEKRKQFEAEKN